MTIRLPSATRNVRRIRLSVVRVLTARRTDERRWIQASSALIISRLIELPHLYYLTSSKFETKHLSLQALFYEIIC